MAINISDFFTKAGKAFHAGNVTNTALGTTIEDEVEDYTDQFTTETIEIKATAEGVHESLVGFQEGGTGLLSTLTASVRALLVQTVKNDNRQPDANEDTAIDELIKQMNAAGDQLDASTPACTPSLSGSNTGNGTIVISVKRPDGKTNEHILGEDIECEVTSRDTVTGEATWDYEGEESVDALSHEWPKGSGSTGSFTSLVGESATNLVTNGDFQDEDTTTEHVPAGWVAEVATLGTTLKLSDVEIQTVAISGTPTGGWYKLEWTNAGSDKQATTPIAWDATSATVQTRLRALTGLDEVTVAQSGTSPNLTHTITFTGVTNPAELAYVSGLTGGTPVITINTTTAASANVVRGVRSVEFASNGAQLTSIATPLTLSPEAQYGFSCLMKSDGSVAAGIFTIDLVEGLGGTVINDEAGTANSFTVDATALTASFTHKTAVFRTPKNLPDTVFLRIRISTAVTASESIFLDEVILAPMTELYTGGPWAIAFTGPTQWDIEDLATLPVTNDRAGALHEWMDRTFDLRTQEKLIPTNTVGGESIADSLIG